MFWFLCTGVLLLIIGTLVHSLERADHQIPGFVVWAFVALTAVAVVVMPISGIWLLIPPAAGLVIRSRRPQKNHPQHGK